MTRYRVGAAYEILAGIVGLAFTLRLTRVPGGAGVTFNILATGLACLSLVLGAYAWTNVPRARQLSVAFQLLQVPQITSSAVIFGFMVGVQGTVRMEGWWLSLYTNGGVMLNALLPAQAQPTVIGINVVALVVALLLRRPATRSSKLQAGRADPDAAGGEGKFIERAG